jgi:hypothetical protein
MVPLEKAKPRSAGPEPVYVRSKPEAAPAQQEPKPSAPRRFRVVDVMTRQVLADDASTRQAVDALKSVRSVVDVNVYAWDEERARWRLLTLPDQRAMLDLARRARVRSGRGNHRQGQRQNNIPRRARAAAEG